ncbi:hypothetical protein WN50_32430 [Limnoraphis robusta CS-951]|uniref:Uncharacterized protein n=1 Tax=Limnoraphis robusta CS-951 TaxID=1637645 RepID=A0A0J9HNQ3_9CYAN|nr:hypothetical protein WN50_32430 [Limnoraphis robusta CS-951]
MNYNSKSFQSKDLSDKHCQYRQRLDQLLASPLTGWDRIFIRDLDRQWKICNRDGKVFKLSAKQSVNLQRIEKEVC